MSKEKVPAFGFENGPSTEEFDWRAAKVDENESDDDDDLLEKTHDYVIKMLGFDPLELDEEEQEKRKPALSMEEQLKRFPDTFEDGNKKLEEKGISSLIIPASEQLSAEELKERMLSAVDISGEVVAATQNSDRVRG